MGGLRDPAERRRGSAGMDAQAMLCGEVVVARGESPSSISARVLLIDGWPLLFRQYHGMRNGEGEDVDEHFLRTVAVSYFRKVSQVIHYSDPTHVSVIFDGSGARQARQGAITSARDVAERELQAMEKQSEQVFSSNVASTLRDLQSDISLLESISSRCAREFPQEVREAARAREGAKESSTHQEFNVAAERLSSSLETRVPLGSEPELASLASHAARMHEYVATAETAAAHDDMRVAQLGREYAESLQVFAQLMSAYADSVDDFSKEASEFTEEAVSKFTHYDNFPGYKSHREQGPVEVSMVFQMARERFDREDIHYVCLPQLEADDVIATLAVRARRQGARVDIVSSDKDFMQLIDAGTRLLKPGKKFAFPRKAPRFSYNEVLADAMDIVDESRFRTLFPGLQPSQHIDYLSLVGDAADNIPGIKHVGHKTALKLIAAHGSVEALVEHVRTLDNPKKRTDRMIKDGIETLLFGKELVKLSTNLALPPGDLVWSDMRRAPSLASA
ncbi:DNA polymerase I [Hondaea fermentalgiana]|uniref:DNA polymerase I n=1 Tax=Hondaea fermentalgiana TaxID=2315210 RepID=A0A2R5GQ04_9STRA|nr:DNA polymerase I [Hondaea fermentalgiana]|eukprot:GBG32947.1 DNA polymerase I [Hondaea fermentalgiana]